MQILSEHRAYDLHSIPYTPPLWCHRALTQQSGAAAASAKLVVREKETELS